VTDTPPHDWTIQTTEYLVASITGIGGVIIGAIGAIWRRSASETRREVEIDARCKICQSEVSAQFRERERREIGFEAELRDLKMTVARLDSDMKSVATRADIAELRAEIKAAMLALADRLDRVFEHRA
jgi:predicted flavoprotein YhiN